MAVTKAAAVLLLGIGGAVIVFFMLVMSYAAILWGIFLLLYAAVCGLLIATASALEKREETLIRLGRRLAVLEAEAAPESAHFVRRAGASLTCPRCGQTQPPGDRCAVCGIHFLFDGEGDDSI